MHRWSISFWVTNLPLDFNTGRPHVLVQSIGGKGAYVQIDKTGTKLQCVCELTGKVVSAKKNLSDFKKRRWYNIIVTCDNLHPGG